MPTVASLNWPNTLPHPSTFHQNQRDLGQLTGEVECVTTTISTARNMMNELLAFRTGSADRLAGVSIQDYVKELDALRWRGLIYRFPTNFPVVWLHGFSPRGFMLPRSQALRALKQIAAELRTHYGIGFQVQQTAGNTIDDIAGHLEAGHLVLISGMFEPTGKEQSLLGGGPHTFGPVTAVDYLSNTVTLVDTGDLPLTTLSFDDFLQFWGRKSWLNLYSRPYTMTVLVPDSVQPPS